MKILAITIDFLPNVSGIATLAYEQAAGLARMGHDVHVLTLQAHENSAPETPDEKQEFKITRFPCSTAPVWRIASLARALNDRIRADKPDFLWCINYRGFGPAVLWAALRHPIPFGLYIHGTELNTETRSFARRRLLSAALRRASLVCTNSQSTADLLGARFGVKGTQVTPGVHAERFDNGETRARAKEIRCEWLASAPAGDSTIVFIAACRMSRQKGIHLVLEAMRDLDEDTRQKMLYICIGGGPELAEFQEMAGRHGLSQQVRFLGIVPGDYIPKAFAAADIYLQPSQPEGGYIEGFGISFLEAQAAGLPCVTTRWGGIPESVREDTTALLVPVKSVSAIQEGILQAMQDNGWRAEASLACIAWARENSWESHASKLDRLINGAGR